MGTILILCNLTHFASLKLNETRGTQACTVDETSTHRVKIATMAFSLKTACPTVAAKASRKTAVVCRAGKYDEELMKTAVGSSSQDHSDLTRFWLAFRVHGLILSLS